MVIEKLINWDFAEKNYINEEVNIDKDPMCGMEVDPKTALKAEHAGKTYFFCSEDCKTRFLSGETGQHKE